MRHLVAAAYLAAGWSVVPVTPGRKHPPLLKWQEFQGRRPSMDELAEWWARWPDANVAIVTGSISNLSVVDIDAAAGGVASLKAQGYEFPKTRLHKTPAGFHLLYQHTLALHTGAGFLEGVDVRSDGGYIVAPPSQSEKGVYTVMRDVIPAVLTDVPPFLKSAKKEDHKPRDPSWVADAMRGVPEAQRNETATRLVGYYHNKGMPRSVILGIMELFAKGCSPPMDIRELEQTIDSVMRYPGGVTQKEWSGWKLPN